MFLVSVLKKCDKIVFKTILSLEIVCSPGEFPAAQSIPDRLQAVNHKCD